MRPHPPDMADGPRSVAEAFAEQTRRTPDATAAVSGAHALSYDALNRLANRIARWIHASSERDGDAPIAVLLPHAVGAARLAHPPRRRRRERPLW